MNEAVIDLQFTLKSLIYHFLIIYKAWLKRHRIVSPNTN